MAVRCFGNTGCSLILCALAKGDSILCGAEDHLLTWQAIYRGRAANHSTSLPSPDLFGSHCQWSRGRTEPTGWFYLFLSNRGGSGSQRSWAATLRRPLCSDLGIKHLPVRKNGINTDELAVPSTASVGHGLCGCRFAQYIQQLFLIPGEAAARYRSINKEQCLGRKTFKIFFLKKSFKVFLLIVFVLLLILHVQRRAIAEMHIRISGIFRTQLKILTFWLFFSFLLISQKRAALPKF